MTDVDAFAAQLLEEAKRFLEKASAEESNQGRDAYLHASITLAFAGLEAHVNAIADDFLVREDLTPFDRSILKECEVQLDHGEFVVTNRLKIQRLEERVEFLHRRFSGNPIDRASPTWARFKAGLKLRNRLTHPKESAEITMAATREALTAGIELLDILYQALYKRPYPAVRRGLESRGSF